MRKLALLAAVAIATAATATPAWADIEFHGQNYSQGQIVLIPQSQSGSSVIGNTNQTNTEVTFATLTGQTLTTPANGQALVQASDGSTPLTSLDIHLSDATATFTYIEFNMSNAGPPGAATTVTVTGYDEGSNPFTYTYNVSPGDPTLGAGANWISLVAVNGEVITDVQITDTGNNGFSDIRQFRIGGIAGPNVPLPEPATWAMMLVGFGAAGVAMRRDRRRKVLLTQLA
jgi:hypothetical protein